MRIDAAAGALRGPRGLERQLDGSRRRRGRDARDAGGLGARRRDRRPLDGDRGVPDVLRRHQADPQRPARRRGRRRAARRRGARVVEGVLRDNADELAALVRRGDVVVLHDPQTAGLRPACAAAAPSWCGAATSATRTTAMVARPGRSCPVRARGRRRRSSRARAYVPPGLPGGRRRDRPPSIDPFSAKNQELPDEVVDAILVPGGHRRGPARRDVPRVPPRRRLAGARRPRRRHPAGRAARPTPDVPLVVQVSRWDRLKDHDRRDAGFADLAAAEAAAPTSCWPGRP